MPVAKKDFDIQFSGLKVGEHRFDYQYDSAFFLLFDYRDEALKEAQFEATVFFTKNENALQLSFEIRGKALVSCDLSGEPFELPLQNQADLQVKFGDAFDDTNDEVLILPEGEHSLNVGQFLYELSVLSLPLKKVHPKYQDEEKAAEFLERMQGQQASDSDSEEQTDPRWNKLKELLNGDN